MASVYALLSEFLGASHVASVHHTGLPNLLSQASNGRYGKDIAIIFRKTAKSSIGSVMPAKYLELKHTIKHIQELTTEIDEIEAAIKRIMDEEIQSPILTIPGISYRMGAMIIAEIGDFSRFDSAGKILAYAGMSPSTYQSGQLDNCYAIWKSEVPDTIGMPFTMPQYMSVIGMNPLDHILKRNVRKASITMLHYHTPRRNLYI